MGEPPSAVDCAPRRSGCCLPCLDRASARGKRIAGRDPAAARAKAKARLDPAGGPGRPRLPAQGETKPSRAFSDCGLPSNSAA